MMEMGKPVRGMRVNCSKRWEDMLPMGNDRFCSSCEKTVVDFRAWDRDALRTYFKENPDSCGQFSIEQVDPELYPIDVLGRSLRRGALAVVAVVTLGGSTQAQEPFYQPRSMEQGASGTKPMIDPRTDREAQIEWRVDGPVCPVEPAQEVLPGPKYRWFVSSRFPFVHRRSATLRGRFVTGCPSF